MMNQRQKRLLTKLKNNPAAFGRALGFTLLNDELHNEWIKSMVFGRNDETLQSHRGSYKTTCVSVGLTLIIILYPNDKTAFMRKTDADVKEIITQVQKMLKAEFTQGIVEELYKTHLTLTKENATEISTNLCTDPRGSAQLIGIGAGSSITGKHFERIFTDDIVNLSDRTSKAERDKTKLIYQELQNLKNRPPLRGRIFNTGTPWHPEDCFTLMPNIKKYDCYSTGLMDKEQIASVKDSMLPSLFAANYELRHIASEDIIFADPETGGDPSMVEQARFVHIDAAYGGVDYTAMTICRKYNGKYYVFGKMWLKHVDDCLNEIIGYKNRFMAGRFIMEDNGDKGYLAKELRKMGERAVTYHEKENKYQKIVSWLRGEWKNVVFVTGTDEEYIQQICDYNENAEHDDAPDSLASIVRKLWKKNSEAEQYTSIMN